MRSLVYVAPNVVEMREMPAPVLAQDDLLVRVDAVGICGSDLHAYKGHDPRRQPPMVLGHEFVGTVEAGPWAGKRVTANPLVVCGQCRYCLQGRSNLCSDRTMIGMSRPGAFAEYLAVPRRCAIVVPDGVSNRAAALTEPAATVVHAVNLGARAAFRPISEGKVLVLGAGTIGLLAALYVAKRFGVVPTVVETNPLRAKVLEAATGIRAIAPDATAGGDFDFVLDAVGVAPTRDIAIAAAAPGSVVVHAGLGDWTTPLDWRGLTLREITLIGCYTYSMSDMHAALAALVAGAFGELDWVEDRPLADGAAAFAGLAAGKIASPKILLRPQ